MDTTVAGIGREVRDLIITDGLRPSEAAERVAERFVGKENGRLRQLLDSGFLAFAFAQAEARTLHTDKLYAVVGDPRLYDAPLEVEALTATPATDGGDPGTRGTPHICEAPVRTRYDAFFRNPWEQVVAVGNTGVRKPIGDFTESDCMVVYGLYRATSETTGRVAKAFRRAAQKIAKAGEGALLRDVWDDMGDDVRLLAR